VFERQKEIGVMRSVGASSFAVTFQFLVEGLIIGITAWLIGIPISLALNKGLVYALNFQDLFDVTYPYAKTLSLGLAGMLLIAGAASFWPSFSASRRTVSDILRYQ
jgi:putative ABC transport system permease protein